MREILKNLNEQQRREFYIKKNYIELYDDIIQYKYEEKSRYNYLNYTELLYRYYNNLKDIIRCGNCSNPVKFKGFNKGYNDYCSKKCVMSDDKIILKRNKKSKETNLERYGVTNYSMTTECKDKIKVTNLNKYGTEYYTQTDEYKDKIKITNLNKYGTEYYTQTDEFKIKSKETNLKKYGESHHMIYKKNNGYLKNLRENKELEYYTHYDDDLNLVKIIINQLTYGSIICNHVFDISKQLLYLRKKRNMKICTVCNPTDSCNTSHYELELNDFITSLGIKSKRNYRKLISPHEIDIYIPSKNFAIEFNGLYWHSDVFKDKNYHLNKTKMCNNLNINLFHIWEDDWVYKKEIIKSMIKNKLGMSGKIYARKCIIKSVTHKDKKTFLLNNHLQGNCNSSINIGLYYDDKLVSLMTFGKLRISLGYKKTNNSQFELLRFVNKLNVSVIGGASKLLKFFMDNFNFIKIISYSKNDYSNGNLYKKLGFNYMYDTVNGYYYVGKSRIRENRYKYTKYSLVENGYDKNKTEREIMTDRGFCRIYDSGNKKWELLNSFL